ncbi:Bidirectional sugar transporter SWEET17 [Bienertia sinuspersici]
MMQSIISVFGFLGTTLSFMQYISPAPTFYRIVKNKSTEEFESLPYICTVLNSSLWTYYGIIKPDYFVCGVNGFGTVVEAIYVLLFIKYSTPNNKAKTAMMAGILNVGVVGGAIVLTYFGLHSNIRTQIVGLLCLVPMVVMYASPLAVLETVIKTKSVEYMPFGLSFILVLAGAAWTIYAILVHDYILGVPNGIGFVFGTIQLIVYYIYRNYKGSQINLLHGTIEEGRTKDPLLEHKNQSKS